MGQVAETGDGPRLAAPDAGAPAIPQGSSDDVPRRGPARRRRVAEREPVRPDDGELALPRREALVDGGSWSLDTRVEKAYAPLDTTRTKGRLTREALAEAGGAAREIPATRPTSRRRFIDLYTRAGSAFAERGQRHGVAAARPGLRGRHRGRRRGPGPPLRRGS